MIKTQRYFIGLEGAVIVAAVLSLNIFHPGLCFREALDARTEPKKGSRTWYGKKRSTAGEQSSEDGNRVEK